MDDPKLHQQSTAAAITNVSRGWQQRASATALGTTQSGLSAALWTLDGAERDVAAEPNDDVYSLGIFTGRAWCKTFVDGRSIFEGQVGEGASNLICAGERPRSILRGCREMLHVYLPGSLLRGVIASDERPTLGDVTLVTPRWTVDPIIRGVAWALLDEMRAGAPFGRLRVDGLGLELAVRLLRAHSSLTGSGPGAARVQTGLTARQLARAIEAMEAGLDRDIGLAEIAAAVGLSPPHFCRAFRRSTGHPPFRWLRQRRIERAKELLADPRRSLAMIALDVGFAGQPQFTTAFRRQTGTTPHAWRRQAMS